MCKIIYTLTLLLVIYSSGLSSDLKVQIQTSKVVLSDVPTNIIFVLKANSSKVMPVDTTIQIGGIFVQNKNNTVSEIKTLKFKKGIAELENINFKKSGNTIIKFLSLNQEKTLRVIPAWLSLLPPLCAIILALILRQVLVSLFVGVWIGATIIHNYNPFTGFFQSFSEFIVQAPADPDKMSILIFSLALGGMIGVMSKMGGIQGIVNKLSRYASNSRRGQLITWSLGLLIFFDDYANTLIVGNTIRPLTDKLKISREKLSYLVDSTAAPVANIAVISTWIGFEIGLIESAFQPLGITDNAYITFFKTIPYNFYPIYALVLGFCIAWYTRDFGPMLKAERRAISTGALNAPGANPVSSLDAKEIVAAENVRKEWYNGLIPIFTVILATFIGLWVTGITGLKVNNIETTNMSFFQYASTVIGASNSYNVLMWAIFLGSVIAIGLAVTQRILTLEQSIMAWVGGIKAMIFAALILTLAWAIGNICNDLKTADYVISVAQGYLSAHYIPLLSFLLSALISFATGTSWGVMAILMPIVIPIAYIFPLADPTIAASTQQAIFISTIASVLAGATFGDHCSPISDTTIMSSMACGADHIDHVRTQLPYALLGGVISLIFGYLLVGFGVNSFLLLIFGILSIILFVRYIGKPINNQPKQGNK